jgi:hypothetical protein
MAGSARNRDAAYEFALVSSRNFKPGDQISYYIKATPKKIAAYKAAKPATEFGPKTATKISSITSRSSTIS